MCGLSHPLDDIMRVASTVADLGVILKANRKTYVGPVIPVTERSNIVMMLLFMRLYGCTHES
jgi:hypothetical protein